MVKTAEEKAEISRQNGAKGRGPTSTDGKRRSSMNACKHGMRARSLTLPGEDPAIAAARSDAWYSYYRPVSPAAHHLTNQCIWSSLLSDRCQANHDETVAEIALD